MKSFVSVCLCMRVCVCCPGILYIVGKCLSTWMIILLATFCKKTKIITAHFSLSTFVKIWHLKHTVALGYNKVFFVLDGLILLLHPRLAQETKNAALKYNVQLITCAIFHFTATDASFMISRLGLTTLAMCSRLRSFIEQLIASATSRANRHFPKQPQDRFSATVKSLLITKTFIDFC